MQYYLPDNYADIDDISIWEPLEFEARIAFEEDYKSLAWNKAGNDKQKKAKTFVVQYVKGRNQDQAAKDFI